MSTRVHIRRADWDRDGTAIRDLCWAYRDLLSQRMTAFPDLLELYYARETYAALLDTLPSIHARPRGDILVAEQDGAVIGCAMYYPLKLDGVCEIKRVFVDPKARGQSAGRKLMQAGMERARRDGHTRMVLDTMIALTEAIALYEALGFTPADPLYDVAPEAAPVIRFFGIDLT